jgi:hypothetical protein
VADDLDPLPGVLCQTCLVAMASADPVLAAMLSPLCRRSRRPCGHHCNHIFTVEECHWCGKDFGEDE